MVAKNVGIKAIEIYFPSQYVDQIELEKFDNVSSGKYTIGLGQSKMGFCNDREDINSLCLTVVNNLLDRYKISRKDIGRLEVGTETIIDKSKSIKTVLMDLFEPFGVSDMEGVDCTNACYGGTAALFNAINWVESSSWDGRLALVVAADNAIYEKGAARPTGGAGAIAMIIGNDAPLVFDQGVRSTFMKHAYDFYKPNLSSSYPVVDGSLSLKCYINALDNCYIKYCDKYKKKYPKESSISINTFHSILFHSPFCKLVQKSFSRLTYLDFIQLNNSNYPSNLAVYKNHKLDDPFIGQDIEKVFMKYSNDNFMKKTHPSLFISNLIGNMYTASVYSGLVSLLINKTADELLGQKIGIFSYGSGLASSFFSLTVNPNMKNELSKIINHCSHVKSQLDNRVPIPPQIYTDILELREKQSNNVPYEPKSDIKNMFKGTYYLIKIDEMYRRTYKRIV